MDVKFQKRVFIDWLVVERLRSYHSVEGLFGDMSFEIKEQMEKHVYKRAKKKIIGKTKRIIRVRSEIIHMKTQIFEKLRDHTNNDIMEIDIEDDIEDDI
jgi:hypothetical protein